VKKKVKFYKPSIQWPDPQQKWYKNKSEIKWVGKVHERLEGADKIAYLPFEEEYCYYHPKTIDNQESQNALYDTIER